MKWKFALALKSPDRDSIRYVTAERALDALGIARLWVN
ncbi:MAG: hypothetical protein Ct9H300mP15_00740 [Gemmatimonadota bacterium]|nr:MAG: hypothetical protein Ct9H300mP15_00740 [Gemmatimonadota bacterium]